MNTNKTICLNSKGGRNGIEGLQPSLNDRIYDSNGISTCVATPNFFMPNYTIYNNKKGVDNMNSETTNLRIRKLTPKECWRLMGFDDEDFEKASKVNSNTQLYKQAGNSIVVNVLEAIFKNMNLPNDIKILELFGGIGACTKALKRIGKKPTVIDYVEIDKYAVASYNAIHNTNFEPQDITTWDKDIEVDLIMHGSPCQDFSLAGKQAGGDKDSGTRSSLMYETIRIVEKLKPKYVIWENVKNLLSKKHRHNFDAYLETMEQLGYKNYYQVLNAKDYGIPQNRERVFTVSILGNENYEFPQKQELKLKLKDLLEDEVDKKYYLNDEQINRIKTSTYISNQRRIQEKQWCDTLCARDWKDPKCVEVVRKYGVSDTEKSKHQAGSVYDIDGLAPTLDTMQGGYRKPCIETKNATKQSYVESKYKEFINENGYMPDMFNPYNKTEIKDIAPTQSTQCGSTGSSATVLIKENRWSDLD